MKIRALFRKIAQSDGLRKILSNASWMAGEQVYRLLISVLVGVWLARYLGADRFGALSYSVAYSALFASLANLGFNRAVVREVVSANGDRNKIQKIVGSATLCRLAASAATCVLVIVTAPYFSAYGATSVGIVALGIIFTPFDTIDLYFQANTRSKTIIRLRSIVFLCTSLSRVAAILAKASLNTFLILIVVELMLLAAAQIYTFLKVEPVVLDGRTLFDKLRSYLSSWDRTIAVRLLRDSWPEIIAGFGTLAIMRLDLLLLGHYSPGRDVGVYSAAVRVSELWYFVITSLVASTFPKVLQYREVDYDLYLLRLRHLMIVLAGVSYAAAIGATLLGPWLMVQMYGKEFSGGGSVLLIHIWSGLFVSLGLASGSWIHAEKLAKLSAKRTMAGALSNLAFTAYLIPHYGGVGAATSTLLSYMVAFLFFDLVDPKMRKVFWMKINALFLRW